MAVVTENKNNLVEMIDYLRKYQQKTQDEISQIAREYRGMSRNKTWNDEKYVEFGKDFMTPMRAQIESHLASCAKLTIKLEHINSQLELYLKQ